ncbi:hypothetical protein N482_14620 [Pseudoalteromonas luteoviolacea NCIMB 1942]|uniref:Uncharacterized protein n=1 Tax=Pseudoalteromonas luteoviolacea NCIMB 1942 TaxID=1365253 RepID=A0A167AJL7_9GAMM|nr:hypothetical protein N482_14620 [Pseudoalteromonas luteoviolacea NCIMB 1942]
MNDMFSLFEDEGFGSNIGYCYSTYLSMPFTPKISPLEAIKGSIKIKDFSF